MSRALWKGPKVHIERNWRFTLCGKRAKEVAIGAVDMTNVRARWVCRSCAQSYLSDRT